MIGQKIDKLIVRGSRTKDGKRRTEYRAYSIVQPGSTKLCLVLPPWHISKALWNRLQKRLMQQGYSLVVVEASEDILTDKPLEIVANFRTIRKLAFNEVQKVKSYQKFESLDVIGLSLGTVSALYAAVSGMAINRLILVCPADDLAEGIWDGLRTKHIRKLLDAEGVTLENLQLGLRELSMRKQDKLRVENVFIYLSEQDSVIPYRLGRQLEAIFQSYQIPVTVKSNQRLGHYLTFINFCLRARF